MTEEQKTPEQIAAEEAAAADARREEAARADAALKKEDDKRKKDLDDTGEAILDDGHSTVPIRQDPTDARKAIMKKVRDNREGTINKEAEANADVAQMREAIDRAAANGTGNELDRNDDFDTNAERVSEEQRRAAREARVNATPAGAAESTATAHVEGVDDGNTMVKVNVLGREFEVPKRDVDADGGLAAYQKNRAADERLRLASKREQELAAERKKIEDERKQLQEQQRATAGAQSTGAPSSTQQGDGGTGDVAEEAQKITDSLYSGDRVATKTAIQKILARPGAAKVDAAEIARQAVALVKAELSQQQPAPVQKPEEANAPVDDPETADLNAYMADKHADILKDPVLLAAAQAKFNELRKLPENANRRLRDIGRDAATFTKEKVDPHPRAEVIAKKQTLPPVTSGTQAHTTPAAPASPSNSSHIERMRKARGLPL